MKEEKTREKNAGFEGELPPAGYQKTDPVMIKACKILGAYARAAGARVCVYDQSYLPVPEIHDEINIEKNICRHCIKHITGIDVDFAKDMPVCPCRELHINAIKKSYRYGGCYTYSCTMGFTFWTSPVYSNGCFAGALLGSGFRSSNTEDPCYPETNEKPDRDIIIKISQFPQAEPEKIQSLAELMLICAESLSTGNEDYYETLKRRSEQQSWLSANIQELREKYPKGTPVPDYPMDKERQLITALRRGDPEAGKRILNEILAVLLFANPDQFKYIQFRAIELVVLLSRTNIGPGTAGKTILEANNACIRRIQEVKTIEELTDVLNITVERMAGQIFSFQGIRHAAALRKAERFIMENYSRKISLPEIAEVSGLSAPYFSTIFKEEMGENLSSYLNRLRSEKASHMLLDTELSLSEIAGSCGFEDQSWFSKIFKIFTGVSPGKYRSQNGGIIKEISENNFSADCRNNMKK
jgi:AraC-like DNA-binding protein